MSESTKTALAVVAVVVMAAAFWLLLLGPKRDKAGELGEQITGIQSEVASEQALAQSSLAAKQNFTKNYAELVQLGKSVPAEAATPSLLVQLNGVSTHSKTDFQGITGPGAAEGGEEPASPEGASALVPIGATAGPAGLLAMPYQLQFAGGFFQIANFLEGIDSLVETKNGVVDAKGRLITVDGFDLAALGDEGAEGEGEQSSGKLMANFSVNTYVTPPGQGITAGATSAGPSEETVAEVP